ncbi:MAG: hypothetical protein AABZ47_03255 [Planctomycetota bacterium]
MNGVPMVFDLREIERSIRGQILLDDCCGLVARLDAAQLLHVKGIIDRMLHLEEPIARRRPKAARGKVGRNDG